MTPKSAAGILDIRLQQAKILFMANPDKPEALNVDGKGTNFVWQMYRMLFSTVEDVPRYFYYEVRLGLDGKKRPPAFVHQSTQDFTKDSGPVTFDAEGTSPAGPNDTAALVAELERKSSTLREAVKAPFGEDRGIPTKYVNTIRQGLKYDEAEFMAKYEKSGEYMVAAGRGPESTVVFKTPLGKVKRPVGISYPKEEPSAEKSARMAVRAAMEDPKFDVMKRLVRRQRVQQGLPETQGFGSGAQSGGFNIVQEQYPEHAAAPAGGFRSVTKVKEDPVPIRTKSAAPRG